MLRGTEKQVESWDLTCNPVCEEVSIGVVTFVHFPSNPIGVYLPFSLHLRGTLCSASCWKQVDVLHQLRALRDRIVFMWIRCAVLKFTLKDPSCLIGV